MSEPELAQQLPNNATQGDEPEEGPLGHHAAYPRIVFMTSWFSTTFRGSP